MIIDSFPRDGRWDSVGVHCGGCRHSRGPAAWPDSEERVACGLHGVSLALELNAAGCLEGEWFCRDFAAIGPIPPAASAEFERLVSRLEPRVLYRFTTKGEPLVSISFAETDLWQDSQ